MMNVEFIEHFLRENAKKYSFYQMVKVLHLYLKEMPAEEGDALRKIIYSASSHLGFAETDIRQLQFDKDYIELETTFLGLSGSQSPLPNFILDELAINDDEDIRKDFLGLFNHRALTILYKGWRKYRYHETFLPGASDKISQCFFALIGVGDEDLRQESELNWRKMLAYIGMITGKSRSQQVLNGVLSHYFSIETSIEEWVMRYVEIDSSQQTKLGAANCALGSTTLLGSRIRDCANKFNITIHNLDKKRFMDFLPVGKEHEILKKVVQFMMKIQMAYDLCLELKPNEIAPINLNRDSENFLGWTTFLGDTDKKRTVNIQVQA